MDREKRLRIVAGKQTLVLTHYGRSTGKPHQVTIWFLVQGEKIYLSTANVQRQWVRNVQKTPRVQLSIGDATFEGEARFISDVPERKQLLAMIYKVYWMYWPFTAFWRLLTRVGLARDNTGALEVTLAPS
jgi:deazaflavin-dependent oxidoreductase (nitroreductase family)